VAIVGEEGDDVDALVKEAEAEAATDAQGAPQQPPPAAPPQGPAPSIVPAPQPASPLAELESDDSTEKPPSSPLARKMAENAGIPISSIQGSGPGGRVIKRDVEAAITAGPSAPSAPAASAAISGAGLTDQIMPVSAKRKIIAQRLSESKFSAPHFYLKMAVFTESMMNARAELNAKLGRKVSVNAYILKFVAEAIKRHPDINSTWEGETIRRFGTIDIGLAVAQEDGLITPIVRDCGRKGIIQIDEELSNLIERARGNKLTPEEYTGATFSISSLGTYGVDEFTAIINPPGSAILTIGQMKKVPVVEANDEIVVRNQMICTLSCDHRVIDGAKGAEFLSELKATVENPIQVLY
jgi:pyruvate dehydrogenase E2 component (dihydrolipoamide acetyltransferase)